MKIEINPNRISDADEAWQDGWNAACAYRNGNLEKAVLCLKEIALGPPEGDGPINWFFMATHCEEIARAFLVANNLEEKTNDSL
jgi:hypothetical protein